MNILEPHQPPTETFKDFTLRDYQLEAHKRAIESNKNVIISNPMRTGKSINIAHLAYHYEDTHIVVILVTNRKLLEQASKIGNVNIIASGSDKKSDSNIYLCMIQTLVNRLDSIPKDKPIILIKDEMVHHSTQYDKIVEKLEPQKSIFFSATPYDENGVEIEKNCKYIQTINIKDLVNRKIWCPVKYYVPLLTKKYDFSNVQASGSDFSQESITREIFSQKWFKDDFTTWFKNEDWTNDHILIYTSTIAQAEMVKKWIEECNINSCVVHSQQDRATNDSLLNDYHNGEIKALISVSSLAIGFDSDISNVLINMRITKVRRYAMQLIGRNRNYMPDKIARTYDFANFLRWHGFPEEEDNFIPQFNKEDAKKVLKEFEIPEIEYILSKEYKDNINTDTIEKCKLEIEELKHDIKNRTTDELLRLYDASTTIEDVIKIGAEVYSRFNSYVYPKTIYKIIDKLEQQADSVVKRDLFVYLVRKRLKTIIKEEKKFYAMFYYGDWLLGSDCYIDFEPLSIYDDIGSNEIYIDDEEIPF